MNNILFIVIILAILYYYYHHQKHSPAQINRPLTHSQETQTSPDPSLTQLQSKYDAAEQELSKTKKQVKDFLRVVGYNSYVELENGIKEMKGKITDLQSEIRELAKRPSKPTNSKGTQKDDEELEKELDNLIKSIQEMNNLLA